MITIERKFHFQHGRRGRKQLRQGEAVSAAAASRIPRASRLMALAIRFDRMIRDGAVADQAELARLGQVTRARLTQIMNLLCLAPDIQETLLYMPAIARGHNAISEKQLRPIAATANWAIQRRMWERSKLLSNL